MKSLTKDSPVKTALQVIQYMNAGMSVVEACKAVGMPRSSFYYIVEKNPEAIADIQKIIDISNREQLVLILQHKMEILENIIQDGLSEKTSPRSRLAIYIKLTQLTDELMDSLQRDNNQDVDFLMTGPKLVKVESRVASR
jgi:ACT domain-containing protein